MKSVRITAYIVSILAVVSSCGAFLLPLEPATKGSLAVALMVAEMHTGATIIYLTSFQKFTRRLKVAYGFICATSILATLGTLQLLVVSAFGLRSTSWVEYGGTEFPFLLSLFVVYVGYSLFGTLLGIKTVGKTPWAVGVIAVLLAIGSTVLPHVPKLDPEPAVDLSIAFSTAQVVCLLPTVSLLFVLKRRAGPLYTPALAWMMLSLSAALLAAGVHLWQYIFLPDDHWFVVYRFFSIFLGISGIFSLKAAISFSNIPLASELSPYLGSLTFFGKLRRPKTEEFTLVDVVIFTANLASNVKALDPFLDTVRYLTSKESTQISKNDQEALARAYAGIENFLIEEEPIRKYTKQELHDIIQSKFDVSQSTFWQQVLNYELKNNQT